MILQAECSEKSIRKTLEKLRSASEKQRILRISSGNCYLSEPIYLGDQDNGIVVEGDHTMLSGGILLSDWRKYSENLLYANLPPEANPGMLLINGHPARMAQFPGDGKRLQNTDSCNTYWKSSAKGGWNRPLNDFELMHMTVNPSDIPAGFIPENASVTLFHEWDESIVRVKAYDSESGIMTFESKTEHPAGAFEHHEYIILNTMEGLLEPGQWMVDRVNHRIIYWPHDSEKNGFEAKIPLIESIFKLNEGGNNITFRNLDLELGNRGDGTPGLRAVNEPGLIDAKNVTNLRMENMHFHDSAGCAARLYQVSEFQMDQCVVERMGAGGIAALESCEARIANNCFSEIGMLCASAIPILAGGYSELVYVQLGSRKEHGVTVIENNRIEHAPYCGIVVGGEDHQIIKNRISDTMKVLNDGAGIYVSRGHRVRVADNLIIGRNCVEKLAHALYLDEFSYECLVENNSVSGSSSPFLAHKSYRNTLIGNHFFHTGKQWMRFINCAEFTFRDNTIISGDSISIQGMPGEAFAGNNLFSSADVLIDEKIPNVEFKIKNGELFFDENLELHEKGKSWKRILFLGDSITQNGWYVRLLQLYLSCRYPARGIECINAGVSGQTAKMALTRLERDVVSQHPDVVIVNFGINDIDRELYAAHQTSPGILKEREKQIDDYENAMSEIRDILEKNGIAMIKMTPCPYDEYQDSTVPNLVNLNSTGVSSLIYRFFRSPKLYGLPFVDTFMPMSRLYAAHPECRIAPDRIHPDKRGHVLMALELIRTLFPEPDDTLDERAFAFPEFQEIRDLEKLVSCDALTHTGGSRDASALIAPLHAWMRADDLVLCMIQIEEKLKSLGIDPNSVTETENSWIQDKIPEIHQDFYKERFQWFLSNRSHRVEFSILAKKARDGYFATLAKILEFN